MLQKYKVVKEKNEEVLYLYLDMNYEFSQELDSYQLEEKTKHWLCNQRIQFNGNKVVIVVNGIVSKVMTMNLSNQMSDNEMILLENNITMPLYDVLLSLLLTNIKMDLPLEAIKAVVILYRSEVLKIKEEKMKIKRINPHFMFISKNYYRLAYPNTYQQYEKLYKTAIEQTNGQYLVYNNQKIEAFIHIASNGYTEEKEEFPYLIKKESFWDLTYPFYLQIKDFTLKDLKDKLHLTNHNYDVHIKNISKSNRIVSLQIGQQQLNPSDMIASLGLASCDATILVKSDGLTFVTRGVGSGLGLSLWGAKALAELGCNAKQILGYYFQKVVLIIPNQL